MDRKPYDSLDESIKEKLRNCKSDAEMQKIITEAGLQELSPEMLEGVSGGGGWLCVPDCASYVHPTIHKEHEAR